MEAVTHRIRWYAVGVALLLTAGCSSTDDPVLRAGTPAPVTTSASDTAPTSVSPAPSSLQSPPAASPGPPSSRPATSGAAPPAGACGTVTAASGLTLQVLDSPGIACADAKALVGKFQAQLAGKQPAGSTQPASATVDGWLCVSGPPASQGGTSCSLDDKTVFASVATE